MVCSSRDSAGECRSQLRFAVSGVDCRRSSMSFEVEVSSSGGSKLGAET